MQHRSTDATAHQCLAMMQIACSRVQRLTVFRAAHQYGIAVMHQVLLLCPRSLAAGVTLNSRSNLSASGKPCSVTTGWRQGSAWQHQPFVETHLRYMLLNSNSLTAVLQASSNRMHTMSITRSNSSSSKRGSQMMRGSCSGYGSSGCGSFRLSQPSSRNSGGKGLVC